MGVVAAACGLGACAVLWRRGWRADALERLARHREGGSGSGRGSGARRGSRWSVAGARFVGARLPARSSGRLSTRLSARLSLLLSQAEVRVSAEDVIRGGLGALGVAVAAAVVAGPALAVVLLAATAGSAPLGLWYLRRRAAERMRRALPRILDHVAHELRAGGTVVSALERMASRPGAAGLQAGAIVRRLDLGFGLREALAAWLRTRGRGREHRDLTVVAAVLRVTATEGGSAASAVEGAAAALRDELAALAEARSQSAQGRLSAVVVGGLPVVSLLLSTASDGHAAAMLVGTSTGRLVLVAGLALEALAVVWMSRIVAVER